MMLQRRNPISPFSQFRRMQDNQDRVRRFAPFPQADGNGVSGWAAPLDVVSGADAFVVRASLPGAAPENIQVTIEDNVLTIRAETEARFDSAEGDYLMRERRAGFFRRSLRLPDAVDQDKAEPCYEHGVLTVTMPKAEPKRIRQLEVKTAETPDAAPAEAA